jgi:hypothetical protein
MSRPHQPGGPVDRRLAGIVGELAIPAPFTMDRLRASLEKYLERPVRLMPVSMGPDAPSGVLVQTAAADYLYYDQQTSPFHQMHIAVSLAARALVSNPGLPSIDPRVIPALEPHLAAFVMDDGAPGRLDDRDADAFAVLVTARAGMAVCPAPVAWRLLRRLRPLHEALTDAVPQALRSQPAGWTRSARVRLHWRVVEIRDAMLALRPWRDTRGEARAAAQAARAAGLIGGAEFVASVEAAVLAHALRARRLGPAVVGETCGFGQPFGLGPDLLSEALWLARVSREFSRYPLGGAGRGGGSSGSSAGNGQLAHGRHPGKGSLHRWRNCGSQAMGRDARGGVKQNDCRLDRRRAPAEAWILRRRFVRRT